VWSWEMMVAQGPPFAASVKAKVPSRHVCVLLSKRMPSRRRPGFASGKSWRQPQEQTLMRSTSIPRILNSNYFSGDITCVSTAMRAAPGTCLHARCHSALYCCMRRCWRGGWRCCRHPICRRGTCLLMMLSGCKRRCVTPQCRRYCRSRQYPCPWRLDRP